MQDRVVSVLIAVAVHVAAFGLGGAIFVKPPEYGVEPGGIEVNLVAALPSSADQGSNNHPEDLNRVSAQEATPTESVQNSAAARNPSSATGDGSSPITGTDPTTLYRLGGGWTNARPSRIRNPAPPYPEMSKKRGEEGLVLLRVMVEKTGHPMKIEIMHSSGFPLLDGSALQTVQRWTFIPAHAGSLPVDSVVEVPIRFRLEDQRH